MTSTPTDALSLRLQEIRDRFSFLYSKSAASADNENYSIGPVMLHEARGVIEICDTLRETRAQLAAAQEEIKALKTERDSFWRAVDRGFDIEPREYFEKEYTMGFASPMEMAVHWLWKRDAKVAALLSEGGK